MFIAKVSRSPLEYALNSILRAAERRWLSPLSLSCAPCYSTWRYGIPYDTTRGMEKDSGRDNESNFSFL